MAGTILYVDDDLANLTVLEAVCAGEFEILTAASGKDALALLQAREVAVLLADQRMPEMSGTELLELASEGWPDTVRILVTAYSDLPAAIGAVNRGQIRHYLSKPWEPEYLRSLLRESLDVYETRRRVRHLEQKLLETERVYALGVVAAGVAHELRNPLTVLQTNLELATRRLESLSPAAGAQTAPDSPEGLVAHHIELSRLAVAQLREIIAGMELANRRRDDERSADLGEVVRLTLRCVRADLVKRARFDVDVEPVAPVHGAPNKLGQVVMNLLINAFEALPDRPRADNVVALRLRPDDTGVRLEVEDNGVGIAPDVLPHVFDPFYTTKGRGGTGLGLAISRQIVAEAGGRISVESEVGRGTRFTVELPLVPGAPSRADRHS